VVQARDLIRHAFRSLDRKVLHVALVQRHIRVFISYSNDSPDHSDRVLSLAQQLRRDGLETIIDQFFPFPPEGWIRWVQRQLDEADFVLCVCTEKYRVSFDGLGGGSGGSGVNWEGQTLSQYIYEDHGYNSRFIPVLIGEQQGTSVIPSALKPYIYFVLDRQYDELYRRLTNQPAVSPELRGHPGREFGGSKAKLFISYSHRDDRYREQLVTHLAGLRRQGVIADWHDQKIVPGTEWRDAIGQNLDAADCVLLLVSSDFLASDFCYSIEMQRALEKHREGRVLVIPVILRAADWQHPPLDGLEALPKNAKPVVEWALRDRAWLSVTEGIRRALAPVSE
jgi:hypothetical protein